MRIEDTAGNIYIKPENCACGLTGGCEKCRGYWWNPKYKDTYTAIPQYYQPNVRVTIDFHEWMFYQKIRCPNY